MRALIAAMALSIVLAIGPALAGSLVVIESNAPGITPGQVLDGSQTLEVPGGMEVTCIGQDGAIVKSCVWVCHAAARSWRSPFTNLTPRMISAN